MINNRQSFRLRQQFDISWFIPEQKIEGEGIIFNISLSGMLFVTDKLFKPEHGLTLFFTAAHAPAFPPKGTLVWFKRVGRGESQYQCGVRFPYEAALRRSWIQWMDENILKLAGTQDSTILDSYLK